MRPTLSLQSGDGPVGKYGRYLGNWGHFGSSTQRGIITYGISANRQDPLAGALHDAIFNTWRRFSRQVWYIAPPIVVGYMVMDWAIKKNHFLYSKEGRALGEDDKE